MPERCLLWVQTVDLAEERGFEMSRKCPMESICTGERCIYLAPRKKLESLQVDKFYNRLRKHGEIFNSK